MRTRPTFFLALAPAVLIAAALAAGVLSGAAPSQAPQPPKPQQQNEFIISLAETGARLRFAVPDFIARSSDPDTIDAARMLGAVLWDDLAYEREFYMIPRDTYKSVPPATSMQAVPFDRWKELGADAVVMGSIEKTGATTFRVEVRLFDVKSGQSAYSRQYDGTTANPRLFAHTASDEIHQQQRALRGVARTKLTFSSDRGGEAMSGTIRERGAKDIYIADYDGANQRRVTVTRTLNLYPVWSPDARTIAFTSYATGFPDIVLARIYDGVNERPLGGKFQSWLSAWSPDGTRLCFTSTRDGNSELYVVNRDGTGLRRLTTNPAIDSTPTWSPSGNQIAFTSDRGGTPQIYIVDVDGLNTQKLTSESYCDRPTWSPAPFNEIAYEARTGPGYDIKVIDVATREVRQLTFGQGSNESPAYSPNGRHLAFSSTRSGKRQIYTMGRDGQGVKQITTVGANQTPDWSK